MPLLPLLLGLLLRFGVPPLREALLHLIDLADYYPFMVGFLLLMSPIFIGWVFGFLLLDDKDQQVLPVIQTTPIGRIRFLRYRFMLCLAAGFLLSLVLPAMAGLTRFGLLWGIPVVVLAAMEGPIFALFLGSVADNKIEGLALGKIGGLVFLGPLVVLFVESNWHLLGGISPAYWVTQAYMAGLARSSAYFFYLGVGAVYHLILAAAFLRLFNR
jgi:fluoroquinolone transport system permease protein